MLSQEPFDRKQFEARARETVASTPEGQSFAPLDAQVAVAEAMATHRRVIAVLPTGSGKTLGATLPFATGQLTPGQMVYMTPLRTLTSAQAKTLNEQIDGGVAEMYLRGLPWDVRQQTGTIPEDPDFEATATVTTFDQALSSALRISYSASKRRRTINAGAILGSYLVADELHLFPRGEALTSLLCLLKHRPGELPFLLMTATLTPMVAERLAQELDAHLLAAPLSPNDMARLGLTDRRRTVRWQATPITAEQIVAVATPDKRVLVVVNTVKRAIELGRQVSTCLEGRLRILHSRFYKEDREEHEKDVTGGFGQSALLDNVTFGVDGGVVIATQVVEVGLDISADVLLTELAPANALVQRWGRCARWGGKGEIVVAPPQPRGGKDLGAEPIYPYTGQDEKEAVQGARAWLEANTGPEGVVMCDADLHAFLEASHARGDERWIARLTGDLTARAAAEGETIAQGLYTSAGQLIRNINTRTILICGYPDERLSELYNLQGFALAPGSLMSLLPKPGTVDSRQVDEDDEGEGELSSFGLPGEGGEWRLKAPQWANNLLDTESESKANTVTDWVEVKATSEILANPLLLVNPKLVSYNPFFGLSLEPGPVPVNLWAPTATDNKHKVPSYNSSLRHRETLEHHVNTMLALLEKHPALWPRVERIASVVEAWCGWPEGILLRLTRAAIVAHDAGKLSPAWQKVIQDWQRAINMPVERWLVHTDFAPGKPPSWNPPPHALSGAAHSMAVGDELDALVAEVTLEKDTWPQPSNVLFTAVATHHSPNLSQQILSPDERLAPAGVDELNRLLRTNQVSGTGSALSAVSLNGYGVAQANVDGEIGRRESFTLALVTRMLRLSDAWSQDPSRLAQAKIVSRTASADTDGDNSLNGGN